MNPLLYQLSYAAIAGSLSLARIVEYYKPYAA